MDSKELSVDEIKEAVLIYEAELKQKKKKEKMLLFLVTIVLLAVFIYMRFFNTAFQYDDWNGNARIGVKYSTAWVILYPAYYQGDKEVREISNMINDDCGPNVKFIYIEDGIETIDNGAFRGQDMLAIRLPNTLSYVGSDAFRRCDYLKKVYWKEAPENTIISYLAFAYSGLESLSIPDGVTEIGHSAFRYNYRLHTIELPDTIENIGVGAFAECKKLKNINIPETLDVLPDLMLAGCTELDELKFHDNFAAIGKYALYLTKVTEEQFPEKLYYASYVKATDYEKLDDVYNFVDDILYNKCYPGNVAEYTTTKYDKELANEYLAKKYEIPIEVFDEHINSGRIWIEGKYYEFPMSYEEFLKSDAWILHEEADGDTVNRFWEHAASKRNLQLIFDAKYASNPVVKGLSVDEELENSCHIVLPGGILMTCNDMNYYHIAESIKEETLPVWEQNWKFSFGSEAYPMECGLNFDWYGNKINRMYIQPKSKEEEK